ncbi:MAG: Asp-tRNA(Asn)/Glu-tRNA(Gln) amidotransferase subunit GatB [Myxococcota bacterium]
MGDFEAVIGLEVHAQLTSASKLFCRCSTAAGPPNRHVCPVCLGLPGALPVINRRAVVLAVRVARSLGCALHRESIFARKNYFYPDLAKGYQISQYDRPFCTGGQVPVGEGSVALTRIHLEEDAAKNLHQGGEGTLVDYNRAGTPLIEIVSEPVLRSAEEAEEYLRSLREILMFQRANDGNLEEGSFRCDANVSLRPRGSDVLGTRTELKNINSFRFVRKALDYEIGRQASVLASGGTVVQETRSFDADSGRTFSMRGKEDAHDYRYFPDPDLPPLVLDDGLVEEARAGLQPMPAERRAAYRNLGLSQADAAALTRHPVVADYFDAVRAAYGEEKKKAKTIANLMRSELFRHVQLAGLDAMIPIPPEALAELLGLIDDGTINGKVAKQVLDRMAETGAGAAAVVEREGLRQLTDGGAIDAVVGDVLRANPTQVGQYREGKASLLGFFVGQVMKATEGKANPRQVNERLRALLEEAPGAKG